jgi:hypothetical protein
MKCANGGCTKDLPAVRSKRQEYCSIECRTKKGYSLERANGIIQSAAKALTERAKRYEDAEMVNKVLAERLERLWERGDDGIRDLMLQVEKECPLA